MNEWFRRNWQLLTFIGVLGSAAVSFAYAMQGRVSTLEAQQLIADRALMEIQRDIKEILRRLR